MKDIRTPCIGICSTTSIGDVICRGCKRYAFEVIDWNAYADEQKEAVLKRIEKLNTQILMHKFDIVSEDKLREGLRAWRVPFDEKLSSYCWLHNLLKRSHHRLKSLDEIGVVVRKEYEQFSLPKLCELIEEQLLTLSEAHYARYIVAPPTTAADG